MYVNGRRNISQNNNSQNKISQPCHHVREGTRRAKKTGSECDQCPFKTLLNITSHVTSSYILTLLTSPVLTFLITFILILPILTLLTFSHSQFLHSSLHYQFLHSYFLTLLTLPVLTLFITLSIGQFDMKPDPYLPSLSLVIICQDPCLSQLGIFRYLLATQC